MTRGTQVSSRPGRQEGVKDRFLNNLNRRVDEMAQQTEVAVFVMGPAKDNESAIEAAALREELIRRCQEEGFSAYAEHEDIRKQLESLGPDVDLCTLEVAYASQVDVLVFVPSSHGAAAEIGYFAAMGDQEEYRLSARCLVLLDESYSNREGFVIQGPVRILESPGATVEEVNLSDHDAAWEPLQRMIDEARRKKVRNRAFND